MKSKKPYTASVLAQAMMKSVDNLTTDDLRIVLSYMLKKLDSRAGIEKPINWEEEFKKAISS